MALLVMRHAPTSLNSETAGPEKIRGWGDVGLEDEGKAVAAKAAESLRAHPPSVIFTSDLPRAKQTADVVSQQLGGVPVVPSPELRTWNVGDITGQPVESAKPKLDELQHATPTKPAPNGESYADFYARWGKVVQQLRDLGRDQDVLAVVHGRQVYSLPHLLKGRPPERIPTHGAPNPGDILSVNETSGKADYLHRAGSAPKVTT
jgi:broad specificity phosphatase PhoE